MTKAHILMVDDDDNWLALTSYCFEGYTLSTARDGSETLTQIHQYAPDLIVTDIEMPGMGGIALVTSLRNEGFTLPIIVSSSSIDGFKTRFKGWSVQR